MVRSHDFFRPALAALAAILAFAPAGASTPEDTRPLFSKDLSNAHDPSGVWSFEEGILSATDDHNLWTVEDHEDFLLELEFRTSQGTNSGVAVYASEIENWIPNSVEIQITDDYSKPWNEADPSWRSGAFFGHKPAVQREIVAEAGEWNHMKVAASGSLIAVELNGVLVNAIDLSDYTSATVAPDGTEIPEWLSKPWAELQTRGRIGFQGKHAGAPIEFRNLRIRSLNQLERVALLAVDEPPPQETEIGLELGSGVNISHWLSQRSSRSPDPRQYFTEADVAFIAEQGFDHIRLPIEESVMWTDNGEPDATAFETLDRTIGWIQEAGLKAVVDLHIINSHHFNASNNEGENTLFTEPASQDHLIDLWTELSARLKKWDTDFLAYEILNEAVAEDHDDWNKLLAKAIPAIRELEPNRSIVVGSNRWQSVSTFPNLRLPKDDRNIILSFHFYSPFFFTHYQASWSRQVRDYDGPINYPGLLVDDEELAAMPEGEFKESMKADRGPHDKETLRQLMSPAIEYAKLHRLPLYCGEWGALKTVDRDDLLRWYRDVSEILAEEGIQHAIWDYQGNFGIKNYTTGQTDAELIEAILGER